MIKKFNFYRRESKSADSELIVYSKDNDVYYLCKYKHPLGFLYYNIENNKKFSNYYDLRSRLDDFLKDYDLKLMVDER